MSIRSAVARGRHRCIALYCVLLSCYGPLDPQPAPEVEVSARALDPAPSSVETLFGATLAEYWDARSGVTANSGRVVSWTGLKNGVVLNAPTNAANQPLFAADGNEFGGTPVVQTSTADDSPLVANLPATLLPAVARPYFAVVHRSRALSQGSVRFLHARSAGDGATELSVYANAGSTGGMYCPDWPNGGCEQRIGSNDEVLRPVISELWVDSDGLHYAIDGREDNPPSGNISNQTLVRAVEQLIIGGIDPGNQVSNASFAQVVVTSAIPSASVRAAYREYVMSAWSLQRCGDGFLAAAEQCDDGNSNDTDGCSNTCTVTTPLTTTPEQILGANVVEWWDARIGVGAAPGGVTSWRGQRNQTLLIPPSLDPARMPDFGTDAGFFQGRPVVKTSLPDNAFLSGLMNATLLPTNIHPYIAVIYRSRTLSTAPERIVDIVSSQATTATQMSMFTEGGSARGMYCPDWPNADCEQYLDTDNQGTSTVLAELWIDASGTHYAENGVASSANRGTANQTLQRALDSVTVGTNFFFSQVSNTNFAQIVVASAPPSTAQRAQYLQYACSEWGLARCGTITPATSPEAVKNIFADTLTEYWDARTGVAANNTRVASWTGLKNGSVLNGPTNVANQPVYAADGGEFAATSVVQTSVADNASLAAQLPPTLLVTGDRPYFAVVHRSRVANPGSIRFLDASSQDGATQFSLFAEDRSTRGMYCPDWPNGGCQRRVASNDLTLRPVISELWVDTDGLHYAQDGREVTPSDGNVANQALVRAVERLFIGAIGPGNQVSDSSFAQIIVTASLPSPTQRANYRDYVRTAWGLNYCGDGYLSADEQCDDGNSVDTDTCSSACTVKAPITTTPDQVLGANVVEWWDARVGVGSSPGVTSWRGHNGTILRPGTLDPARLPGYATDTGFFLERPIVQSSLPNQAFLSGLMNASFLPANAYPYMAVVHRSRTLSTDPERVIDIGNSQEPTKTQLSMYSEQSSARGTYCPDWPDPPCQYYLDTNNQQTSVVLTEVWVDANGAHYAENGVESSAVSGLANQPLVRALDQLTVGASFTNSQYSNNDYAQIVLASGPPSPAQRAQYLQYACQEWGLSHCSVDVLPSTGTTCNPMDSHCGFGRECRSGVGDRFGRSASDYVCWDTSCDDYKSGVFECGSTTSLCGTCPACASDCGGKSCGSNGCWGSCGSQCLEQQRGCASSADCAPGLVCMPSASGPNVCLQEECGHPGLNPCSDPANAGMQTACGQCPACVPICTDRQCGPGANGCGDCSVSTLNDYQFCSPEGHILYKDLEGNISLPPAPPDGPTTVGTMAGTFAVSDFGQASYRLPLQLPPGRNGVGPELTLVYNSSESDGYLGNGWGLSGLSAIQRCPKTFAQDNVAEPIKYSDDDRFCLDGSRLVLANDSEGAYGTHATFYRTEVDSFSRIELFRPGMSPEPERFEVKTADGRTLTYDLRVGGRAPQDGTVPRWDSAINPSEARTHTWLLTKVEDGFHNTMRILYSAPAAQSAGAAFDPNSLLTAPSDPLEQLANGAVREYYPSSIEYTSNGDIDADRTISFGYRPRSETLSGYNAGVRFERSRLLQTVVARVQGEIMFSYTLRYDEPSEGASEVHTHSRLTSVEQCARAALSGTNSLVCMPKTRFEYTQIAPGFEASQSNGIPNRDTSFLGNPLVLDMDGDGRDDILFAVCPNGAATCDNPQWSLSRNGAPPEANTSVARSIQTIGTAHVLAKAFVVDYDLDGKDDVIEIDARTHADFRVLKWSSGKLDASEVHPTLTHPAASSDWGWSNVYLLDANGDGGTDLLACTVVPPSESDGTPYNLWQRRMYDGSNRRFSDDVFVVSADGPPCDDAAALDIDGDGAQELLLNVAPMSTTPVVDDNQLPVVQDQPLLSGVLWPMKGIVRTTVIPAVPNESVRLALDFNGDGLVDIAELSIGSHVLQVQTWTNTGAGFVSGRQAIDLTGGPCPNLDGTYLSRLGRSAVSIDDNGDGRGDLVFQCGAQAWAVLRSLGDTFSIQPLDTDVLSGSGSHQFFAYDANNDGSADLAAPGNSYVRSGAPYERLAAVTNGLGARIAVDYASLASSDNAQGFPQVPLYRQGVSSDGCTYPAYCRHPRSSVVRAHHVWDHAYVPNGADAPTNTFWYGYADAVRDLRGRGDLGFGGRVIVDELRNNAAKAAGGNAGGEQKFTLLYDNKRRDEATGLYPLAGRAYFESDWVTIAPNRVRQSGFVRDLSQENDPDDSKHNLVVLHPTPRSLFAYFRREKDLIEERELDSVTSLKDVEYRRQYDELGNLVSYSEVWAEAGDNRPADDVTVTTEYALGVPRLNNWQIRSPRKTTITMHGDATVTRVRRFVYAEDPATDMESQTQEACAPTFTGSGNFPFTGEPEAVIDQPCDAAHRRTQQVVYNAFGNVVTSQVSGATIDGERQRTTEVVYDNFQMFPVYVYLPDQHVVHVDYDQGLGQAVATSEAGLSDEELVTRAEIPDGFGRIRRVITADHSTTEFSYVTRHETGAGGLRVETTRPGSPPESVEVDVLGRTVLRRVEGFKSSLVTNISYAPEGIGKPTAISRPHVSSESSPVDPDNTLIAYDPLGRITSLTLPNNKTLERCYKRNAVCSRDQSGQTSCTVFDEHGRAAHRVEPAADAAASVCDSTVSTVASGFPADADPINRGSFVTKRFHYYPTGDLLSIIDTAGHETRFERDDRGNVTNAMNLDSGSWQRQYNAFDELEVETSPTSTNTVFRYDLLGRLINRTDLAAAADGSDEVTTFAFDYVDGAGFYGKPVSTRTPDGVTTAFGYDEFGRLNKLAKTIPVENGSQTLTRHTSYDAYGRPELITYDNEGSLPALSYRYKYGSFGYLQSVGRPNAYAANDPAMDAVVWSATDVNSYDQLTDEQFGNGVQTHRSYEAHTGRLLGVSSTHGTTKIQDVQLSYYDDGMLHTRTNNALSSPTVKVFDYDSLKRLKAATTRAGTVSGTVLSGENYEYDDDGNVKTRSWSDASAGFSYSWTFNYNPTQPHAVSNIVSGTESANLHYLSDGSVDTRMGSLQSTLIIANDARARPRKITAGGFPVELSYDATGTRVRRASPSFETIYLDDHYSRHRVPGTSGFEEQLSIGDGETTFMELDRTPTGREYVYYIHPDHLGSIEALTDQLGTLVQRRDYESFGTRHVISGGTVVPLRGDFTGHELDHELGLINMKARIYDPQIGRFLSADPIVADPLRTQGSNPYSYVENNPLNLTDPTGLCTAAPGSGQNDCNSQDYSFLLPATFWAIKSIADGTFNQKLKSFGRGWKFFWDGVWEDLGLKGGRSASPPPPSYTSASNYDARQEQSTSVSSIRYVAEATTDFGAGLLNSQNPLSLVGLNVTSLFGHEDAYRVGKTVGAVAGIIMGGMAAGKLLAQGVLALRGALALELAVAEGVESSTALGAGEEFLNLAKSVEGGNGARGGVSVAETVAVGPRAISPSALTRTEALSGASSRANVSRLAESMKSGGWQGPPVKVFEHNGAKYIIDGHHRVAAARQAGIDVVFESVGIDTLRSYGYGSVEELVWSALEVGPNKL